MGNLKYDSLFVLGITERHYLKEQNVKCFMLTPYVTTHKTKNKNVYKCAFLILLFFYSTTFSCVSRATHKTSETWAEHDTRHPEAF